jgi:hypothetical protein
VKELKSIPQIKTTAGSRGSVSLEKETLTEFITKLP